MSGFFDKIGANFTSAVSAPGLANTGMFVAGGAVLGGLMGGFGILPLLLGALGGFLGTALTGVKLIGGNAPAAPAPTPDAAPRRDAFSAALGPAGIAAPNPGLPSGLTGNAQQPQGGAGRGTP